MVKGLNIWKEYFAEFTDNYVLLICLKAKAYIDMLSRKSAGEDIDKNKIDKHKKDVIRLVAMLPADSSFDLPESLKKDVAEFCEAIQSSLPNQDFIKSIGLRNISAEELIAVLKKNMNVI
jgi:hypothetical protein